MPPGGVRRRAARRLGPELDLEGLGLALQLAIWPHPVGAGAPQRGRVGVNRHRGSSAGVQDPMNRRRRHDERFPGAKLAAARSVPQREPVFADATGHDCDRCRRIVVVVKTGVLILAPADHPGVDLRVIPDLFVDPGIARVPDEVLPALPRAHELLGKPRELFGAEAHARATGMGINSAALAISSASRPVGMTSITGRSDPYTS